MKIKGLYQPTYTKQLPDGTRETRRSEGWWFQYYANKKRHRVNLADFAGGQPVKDRRVAERLAAKVLHRSEEKRANLVDPLDEHARRPLEEHVKDFETAFEARDVVDAHRDRSLRYVREFVTDSKAAVLQDVDGTRASEWLSSFRAKGRSARTVNARRAALRQFGGWLVRERRVAFDPFLSLSRLNEDADRRHERRALRLDELPRLLDAARRRPLEDATRPRKIRTQLVSPALSEDEKARLVKLGELRALVYAVAAGTGLRRGELGRTRWQDVDLDLARVSVPASSAKSRKDQFVDLRSDLALALKAFKPADAKASSLVFPADVFPNLRTFKQDLLAAGLARVEEDENGKERIVTADEEGRVFDFHALRTTLGSQLAAAGVHPAVAKTIMRHSTIELTMKHYTDARLLDTKGALERLTPDSSPDFASGRGHRLG